LLLAVARQPCRELFGKAFGHAVNLVIASVLHTG